MLGAGASVTSGIPGAATLAKEWFKELLEGRTGDEAAQSAEEWAEGKLAIKGFDRWEAVTPIATAEPWDM